MHICDSIFIGKEEGNKMKIKKIGKMNEVAWVLGIVLCALGVCLCTKADFGLSMVAAPPYILHLKMSTYFSWWTQGTSEYIWQGFLLLLMCIILRRFKGKYLLCFATAVLSGLVLDGWFWVFGGNGAYESLQMRIISFVLGELIITLAIAFCFKTSMPLQIYELFVIQVAEKRNVPVHRVKPIFDIVMLVISVALAFLLTGGFNGIGIGTVVIAFVNAPLIRLFTKLIDTAFTFEPRFAKLIDMLKV